MPDNVSISPEVDQMRSLHTLAGKSNQENSNQHKLTRVDKDDMCPLCKEPHDLDDCVGSKGNYNLIIKHSLSKNNSDLLCLTPHHHGRECHNRRTCGVCSKRHPTSLHEDQPTWAASISMAPPPDGEFQVSDVSVTSIASVVSDLEKPGRETMVYPVLGNESTITFVVPSVKEQLGIQGVITHLRMSAMTASEMFIRGSKYAVIIFHAQRSETGHALPIWCLPICWL